MKRQIWKTEKAGKIKALRQREEKLPKLDARHVRIEVKSIGLNFADIFAMSNLYSATPKGPFIPGLEFSGVISELGSDVTSLETGQRVMAMTRFGAYASSIDIEPDYCFPITDDWSFNDAAAFPVQSLTAWYGLKNLGDLKAGKTVLIHSAAGGVGLQAMAIAKQLGATVIGTVSSEKKKEFLHEKGYDEIIVRWSNFYEQLMSQLNGRALDIAMDAIGGGIQKASYNARGPIGRLVTFGAAQFTPGKKRVNYLKNARQYLRRPKYDSLAMINENRSVMAFNLIWLWNEIDLMKDLMQELHDLDLAIPHVGHEYQFDQMHDAIEMLRSGKSIGKVVVTI